MANPYGIEQVDVPGILSAYDAARQRRVQMMLQQRQMDREDLQLDREHNMLSIMAKIRAPGPGGTASTPSSAPVSPPDAATAPSAPLTAPTLPASPGAPPVGPVAVPATVPATTPAVRPTWSDTNQGVIGQLMTIDPAQAIQLSQHFRSMDDAQVAEVKRRNDAIAHVALSLQSLPEAERPAELQRRAASDLIPYGVDPASLTNADLSDRGLAGHIAEARDLENIIKDAKPDLMAVPAGSSLIDKDHPENGAVYTAPADIEHFSVHNADGSDTPYGFDKKTGRAFQLTDGGTPGAGGGTPTSINVSPKMAAVASTLSAGGLPAPVVAGFMGNFHIEGGYDGAHGDGGSASGIAQLHAERATNFERVIGKPVDQASPAEQAQFTLWEMQNPQAAGMTVAQRDKILAAKTPAEAASLIDQFYERSNGKARQGRMDAATAFAGGSAPAAGGTGTPIRGAPLPHDAGDDDTAKFIGGQVALGQPMPPLGMGKEAAAMRRAILAEATKQWKAMGISPGEANVIAAQNKSGLAELGRIASIKANVLTAENTANSNASQVISLLGSTGTTGVPIFNAWQQAGRRSIAGDPKVSAFDVAVKTLATEYARVMSGGGNSPLSDSARHEADALIHTSMTPDQFRAAIRQMKIDMANRSAGIEQERQATLSQIRTGGRGAPSAPAAPSPSSIPTLTVEQARAAPKGTVFRTTDGRTMRKQ